MMLGNSNGKFSINIAGLNGAFFADAQSGDVVLKNSEEIFSFSLNNSANNGTDAFVFGDNLNRKTFSIFNNGKGVNTSSVGTGISPSPNLKLQIKEI